MKLRCAWCGADMGEIAPDEPGISHGICPKCRDKILAEHKAQDNVLTPEDGADSSPPFCQTPRPSFHRKVKCK